MILAPIVLFVYNRPWHTQQTIEALQKNELAGASELFIYSDAPKIEQAVKNVNEVREYIKNIAGFKKITIIEREKNWGLANSIIDGVTTIVNQYSKIIVLEDDLVTSPYFLKFLNEALLFYADDKQVMSISGYTYPFKSPSSYEKDIFLFYRSSSWGWAVWKDEWSLVNFNITEQHEVFKRKDLQKKLNRGGNDLYEMLKMQLDGRINSWAIRFALSHSLNEKYTLYPIKSFVKNIGHDTTGTHCGDTDIWNVNLNSTFYPVLEDIKIDRMMIKAIQQKFKKTKVQKLKYFISKLIK